MPNWLTTVKEHWRSFVGRRVEMPNWLTTVKGHWRSFVGRRVEMPNWLTTVKEHWRSFVGRRVEMPNWLTTVKEHWRSFVDGNAEIFKWPNISSQPSVHCRLDEEGRLFGLDRSTDSPQPVCLHLPPNLCLLRRLTVTGLSAKEIEPALSLWAEESLPGPFDNYAFDSWRISADIQGLVAVPRKPLDQARRKLKEAGAPLRALQVPELLPPPDQQPTLIFWSTLDNLLACFWDQQVLYEWQSFPPGSPTRATFEQANVVCKIPPVRIYRYGLAASEDEAWSEARAIWPHAEFVESDIFDPLAQQQAHDIGPAFHGYIHESRNQPATSDDKLRLGLAGVGACLTALFLFHADIVYRERQVEQLRHQVSLLKIKANRSEKLASRSGKTLRQVRELRAMTIERKGVLHVLQTLEESLPPRVKIENLSVERSGAIALDGIAETEVDISTFLNRLRRSPLLGEPNLSFSQKDTRQKDAEALLRFRLEVRWAKPLLTLPETERFTPGAPKPAKTA